MGSFKLFELDDFITFNRVIRFIYTVNVIWTQQLESIMYEIFYETNSLNVL